MHRASGTYRGDGKADAKDAFVIADQARMRRDLQPLRETSEIAVDLKILTARRMDLSADRTRAVNRLRVQMLEYFRALERAFDYSTSKTALILLTGYQTPATLRRIGQARLAVWLKNQGVRIGNHAKSVADAAVGDVTAFGSPDRLAGPAPVPRDSGKISGNLRRPRRYSRRLPRVFHLSAQVAAYNCAESKAFYQRKRAEGKSHKHAVLALARLRLNVLWALIRDQRPFEVNNASRIAAAAA